VRHPPLAWDLTRDNDVAVLVNIGRAIFWKTLFEEFERLQQLLHPPAGEFVRALPLLLSLRIGEGWGSIICGDCRRVRQQQCGDEVKAGGHAHRASGGPAAHRNNP
jgi:hypothetical protein